MFVRILLIGTVGLMGCSPSGGGRVGTSGEPSSADGTGSADQIGDTVTGDATTGDTGAADTSTTGDSGQVDDTGTGADTEAGGDSGTDAGEDPTTTGGGGCDSCPDGTACVDGAGCCTCAPAECSDGIDNAMAGMAGLVNSSFQSAVDQGDLNFIINLSATQKLLTAFTAVPIDPECLAEIDCGWALIDDGFNADCDPRVVFDEVTIEGDTITAVGADLIPLPLPAADGLTLELAIFEPRFMGTITQGGLSGVLAGAISKATLADAIDALPEDALPIPKDALKDLLETLVQVDMDVLGENGKPGKDGVLESVSVGLVIEALPGLIQGYATGDDALCLEPKLPDGKAYRVHSFKIGGSGQPGQGLDVDQICY